jgi:hypothetical protein
MVCRLFKLCIAGICTAYELTLMIGNAPSAPEEAYNGFTMCVFATPHAVTPFPPPPSPQNKNIEPSTPPTKISDMVSATFSDSPNARSMAVTRATGPDTYGVRVYRV